MGNKDLLTDWSMMVVPSAVVVMCAWAGEKTQRREPPALWEAQEGAWRKREWSCERQLSLRGLRGVLTQRRWSSVLNMPGAKTQVGNVSEWGWWG